MFSVVFTCGEEVDRWTGFATRAEAAAAISDADLIIPFAWDCEIIHENRGAA
jgi:hypothetical protein